MSGAGTVQCPHCGAVMDERARFCPGCETPRTAVREDLEREAKATGLPYAHLLERARSTGPQPPPVSQPATGWGTGAPSTPAPRQERGRVWLVLGIIGGVLLLLCVGCVAISAVLIDRFNVNLGDSPEGDAARHQLELATEGRHEERWELLHPDQQVVVPVDLFETCANYEDAGEIDIFASFASDDSFVSRVGIVDTRVVIYSLSDGGSTETDYVEMVRLDSEWRWTLTEDDLLDFESGRCP